MRVRSVLTMVMAVLLAVVSAASPAARAGDDPAKPWKRVEYQAGASRKSMASVVLTSRTDAELVPKAGAEPLRGTWSVLSLPRPGRSPAVVLRIVLPDRRVLWLPMVEAGLGDRVDAYGDKARMTLAAGRPWHDSTYGELKRAAKPSDGFLAKSGEGCYLHADGTADWETSTSAGVRAVDATRTSDGTVAVAFPDGTHRVFRPTAAGYADAATGEAFTSIRELELRARCTMNLAQIAGLFIVRPGKPTHDGAAVLLSWRTTKSCIQPGEEWLLRCPSDPHLRTLDEAASAAYGGADLKDPPLDLCSYAVRDFTRFPLRESRASTQILACDRQGKDGKTPHHPDGVCVAFDDGRVKFMTRADLGLKPDEPIVVGPDSTVEMLRIVCQVPKR